MPLPRQRSFGGGNMRELYNMFRINPNAFPGVNPGVFNEEANDQIAENTANYKATSPEMIRQGQTLSALDNRTEIGIRQGLEEAGQVRDARNRGFDGSHPLKDREDYNFMKELELKSAPARIQGQYQVEAAKESAAAKAAALEQLLSATGTTGNRSVSVPGVGSVGAARREPQPVKPAASVLNKLQSSRLAAEKNPDTGNWLTNLLGMKSKPSPESVAHEQAQGNALQGVDPQLVGLARTIAQRFPDADLGTALAQLGEDQLDDAEIQQINNALLVLRGY